MIRYLALRKRDVEMRQIRAVQEAVNGRQRPALKGPWQKQSGWRVGGKVPISAFQDWPRRSAANRNTVHLTILIRVETSMRRVRCRFRGRRL